MDDENNDKAILQHPKRRAELTNFIADFLEKINMPKSSAKLKQEAQLKSCKSVQDFIRDVINDEQILQKDKSEMIREHLQKLFLKELSCSKVQEALVLLQKHFPAYFSEDEIETFTTYFIEPPPVQQPFLNKLICEYVMLGEEERLPRFKKYYYQVKSEIWFAKSCGHHTITIDNHANARLIKGGQIIADRWKIHQKDVTCVKWKNQHIFATGSEDAKVKIWNSRIICLRIIGTHESQINGIAFSNVAMITGGRDNFMLITKYDQMTKIQTCKLQITKICCKKMVDLLYLNKKNLSACLHIKASNSVIIFINLNERQQVNYIKTQNKIYNIALSNDEDFLFANSSKAEIIMYSMQSYEIVRKFGGYFQQKFIMRMEIHTQSTSFRWTLTSKQVLLPCTGLAYLDEQGFPFFGSYLQLLLIIFFPLRLKAQVIPQVVSVDRINFLHASDCLPCILQTHLAAMQHSTKIIHDHCNFFLSGTSAVVSRVVVQDFLECSDSFLPFLSFLFL